MLSIEQVRIMDECINKMEASENKEEMFTYFLQYFCSTIEGCNFSLRMISKIAEQINIINSQRIAASSDALDIALRRLAEQNMFPSRIIGRDLLNWCGC